MDVDMIVDLQHPASADDIIEAAAKQAVTTTPQEQAAFLLDAVGARITTAAVGLKDARAVRGWADGKSVKEADVEQRLQELYQVVVAISEAYSSSVAVAFLRGTNPHLGDRAPLVVLADSDPNDAGPALLKATRALIEE
jgi:protein gp37